jgi:hypothetical protein
MWPRDMFRRHSKWLGLKDVILSTMLYKASYKPSGRSKDPRFENVTT